MQKNQDFSFFTRKSQWCARQQTRWPHFFVYLDFASDILAIVPRNVKILSDRPPFLHAQVFDNFSIRVDFSPNAPQYPNKFSIKTTMKAFIAISIVATILGAAIVPADAARRPLGAGPKVHLTSPKPIVSNK